jgi:hypothetical protein
MKGSAMTHNSSEVPDLDDLLQESVAIAGAKKAKNQGRKLSADQLETLENNRLAAEAAQWNPTGAVAHLIESRCECGAVHTRFSSWYIITEHRKHSDQRRLTQSKGHDGLGAFQHTTIEIVECCHECLGAIGLPFAQIEVSPLLTSLGMYEVVTVEQLELNFAASREIQEELFEELEEIPDPEEGEGDEDEIEELPDPDSLYDFDLPQEKELF